MVSCVLLDAVFFCKYIFFLRVGNVEQVTRQTSLKAW